MSRVRTTNQRRDLPRLVDIRRSECVDRKVAAVCGEAPTPGHSNNRENSCALAHRYADRNAGGACLAGRSGLSYYYLVLTTCSPCERLIPFQVSCYQALHSDCPALECGGANTPLQGSEQGARSDTRKGESAARLSETSCSNGVTLKTPSISLFVVFDSGCQLLQ